jgi:putative N6-adenine-specific DNA methylase
VVPGSAAGQAGVELDTEYRHAAPRARVPIDAGRRRLAALPAAAHASRMRTGAAAELSLFAVTAPGLEAVCAAELAALGMAGDAVEGGVAWRGGHESLYRANLWSRTASRVIVRVGEFRARTFAELERHAARLPWTRFLVGGTAVALRVTSRKSKLYHSDAVAERVARVLAAEAGADASVVNGAGEDDEDVAAQLVVIRFVRDVCTVSIDASGRLLHRRGYRQAVAKAPLRETLAAAMLLASGWRGTTPLVDPLCGSGTIAIEAALMARGIAPGLANAQRTPRKFAFERWPGFDASLWSDVAWAARVVIRPDSAVAIVAADRDGGAIAAARANAERAGVQGDIAFVQRPLSSLEPPAGPGHLVTNPPYGVRVGEHRELHALYAALGRVARQRLAGWTVALLSADPRLDAATGLPLAALLATRNGGIPVRLVAGVG